jgi:hypothetical protein
MENARGNHSDGVVLSRSGRLEAVVVGLGISSVAGRPGVVHVFSSLLPSAESSICSRTQSNLILYMLYAVHSLRCSRMGIRH